MKRVVTIILLIASALSVFAQATVEAKIDPIEMMIGEQANVVLTVQKQDGDKVEFPTWKPRQLLVPGVEVLDAKKPITAPRINPITKINISCNIISSP